MLMARALELWNIDHVIALKFPAYLARHPNKTLWLLHQYRQAYDLYDAGHSNLPPNQMGEDLRSLIRNADNESFREFKNIFTISEVTRQRLLKYNGVDARVLLPPAIDPELFIGGRMGDYIFAGGRINSIKRQLLLLQALSHTSRHVKLLIGGPPDTPKDGEELKAAVERLGLTDRVKLDLRLLPRKTYAKYMNEAAAVAYIPFGEDSLGYVTMEAALAEKALITTTDSGGVLGLVKNGQTGWVAEPNVASLAEAMSSVWRDPGCTQTYGEGAKELWIGMDINWPRIVETLLK
jgi:glycosyltransferase involved in cell wall biosynthesis